MRSWNNQKLLVPTNRKKLLVASRVCDFVRMNSPKILGLQVGKDPYNFIHEVYKIFVVMQLTGSDRLNWHPTSLRMWLTYGWIH